MNDAEQIEHAAALADLSMAKVCAQAKVSHPAFSVAKRDGRKMRALTKVKLMKAIEELSQ